MRSRWLPLAVLCAGMLMVILDGSIVTVALPAIQRSLGFTSAGLAWVVDAYLVAFAGLLLLAGKLGDLIGGKRVFGLGVALFTVASLLCGVSWTPAMLIAARFAQGVGGAMASAVSLGMIATLFTEPRERATAMGAFSFVGAAGASIGQVLGGVLTQAISWHWIFFINVPIGLVTYVLAQRVLPAPGERVRSRVDVVGAVLATGGLMLGVYALVQSALWQGVIAAVLLIGFVVRQATAANPLLPLRIFRSRAVVAGNVVQALMIAAMFGFQIIVALYLENVRGYGAAATGAAMLPAAVMIGGVSLGLSARLNSRFGERRMLLVGLASLCAALVLLLRASDGGSYLIDLLPTMLLIGGGGLAMPALASLVMSGSTAQDAGVVSGLFNTAQQVGAALGVAVLATLAAARTNGLVTAGVTRSVALTDGYRLAWEISAVLLAVAFVWSAAMFRATKPVPVPTPEAVSAPVA